jgi:ketosteroid isomerase-like protein
MDGAASMMAAKDGKLRIQEGRDMAERVTAREPEDITRLFVERARAGDADGLAALYEPEAVLAYPPGSEVTGRAAILAASQKLVAGGTAFAAEEPLPTVRFENLALTSTRAADGTGGRVQVVRRQADGSWLRIIDRPELPA